MAGFFLHSTKLRVARLVDLVDLVGVVLRRAGDDEGGARLVDEDGVDLVDDAVVVPALDAALGGPGHVVAQVVEAELVVGAVGDVAGVFLAPDLVVHVGEDHADREAEVAVDLAHPLGIALGEVVVDGDDVHAVARKGVEVRGADRGEGFALAGLHLDYLAVVEDEAAEDLHVEGTLAQDSPARGLAHEGEGLGEELVEGLAGLVARLELGSVSSGNCSGLSEMRPGFLGVDFVQEGQERLDVAFLLGAENEPLGY